MMEYALINTAIASLRKEARSDSELIDEALYGMKVAIIDKVSAEWFLIQTHYEYLGYVHRSELLFEGEAICSPALTQQNVITKAYADVLESASIRSHVMLSLTRGAIVSACQDATENGFTKIILYDGREGYLKTGFLANYQEPCKFGLHKIHMNEVTLRKGIVKTALSYLGTQYRWGGKTPLGIDCSGLCSMAYLLNGIIIYRDAKIAEGFPVHTIEFSAMQPADLIYFPGHIALYLGDDKYIHSTNRSGSDGVVVNSFNAEDPDYREDLKNSILVVGSIF